MTSLIKAIKLLSGLGLIALAIALTLFTLELKQLRTELPQLLAQVDQTAQRVAPVIDEINKIQQLIPPILEQSKGYQDLIPQVLSRVDDINDQIPTLLNEIEQVRTALPPLVHQSEEWRKTVPALLERVDSTNKTVRDSNQQIAQVSAQVPSILKESENLRTDVPIIISQAENLVLQAEQAGREASKGAVTGVISGIFTSPIQLIDRIGDATAETLGLSESKSFTKEDQQLHKNAITALLKRPKKDKVETWSNSRSGNTGTVTIQSISTENDSTCYSIRSQIEIAKGPDKGLHNVVTDKCIRK